MWNCFRPSLSTTEAAKFKAGAGFSTRFFIFIFKWFNRSLSLKLLYLTGACGRTFFIGTTTGATDIKEDA